MRTLEDYLNTAMTKAGIDSNRKLASALDVSPHTIHCFRTKKNLPADSTMLRLATLAKIDPTEALLELNFWRTSWRDDVASAQLYKAALERLIHTAAALLISLFFIVNSTPSEAGTLAQQSATSNQALYIMESFFRSFITLKHNGIVVPCVKISRSPPSDCGVCPPRLR